MLDDILEPDLDAVLCGIAVGECSALRVHYHAGRADAFWRFLHDSGLTPRPLTPEEDVTLPGYGLGLTDLTRAIASENGVGSGRAPGYDVAGFAAKIERYRPAWVAFHGKRAAQTFRGRGRVDLGEQDWTVGPARAFVLPSASGANRRVHYDGRPTRLEWWEEFADLVRRPGRTDTSAHGRSSGRPGG